MGEEKLLVYTKLLLNLKYSFEFKLCGYNNFRYLKLFKREIQIWVKGDVDTTKTEKRLIKEKTKVIENWNSFQHSILLNLNTRTLQIVICKKQVFVTAQTT